MRADRREVEAIMPDGAVQDARQNVPGTVPTTVGPSLLRASGQPHRLLH